MLLFMGSNTSSWVQNPISTIQIVATWVSNLSSKFQLNQTKDEVRSTLWWNLDSEMYFSFLSFLLSVFFIIIIVIDLGPNNMGLALSHTRKPNKSSHPDYVRGSTKPACFLQNYSFSVCIGFIIIFDRFSSIWIFLRQNNFYSSASWIQWYLTSICLDLEWKVGFLLRWIAIWLS